MPNTPAQVGEGMSAACPNEFVSEEETKTTLSILSAFGKAEIIPENLFDVVTGISGSGPAYVFLFIEALADAAVVGGMLEDRPMNSLHRQYMVRLRWLWKLASIRVNLRIMVCSPAGTTIAAVRTLEANNFRSAVIEGANAATEKSAAMRG